MRLFIILPLLLVLAACGSREPEPHAGHEHARDATGKWTCSMHPQVIADAPGTCPICGMNLVAVRQGAAGDGVVEIDPVTLQSTGVRTARAEVTTLDRTLRTTGRFEINERARTVVTPKVGGFVERLYVDYEGARVRRGQPVLEIYSPELLSTQQEYLLAYRNAQRLSGGIAGPDARRLVEAARRRLALWDISEAQIRRLETTGEAQRTLTLHAQTGGVVVRKDVVRGQQIMPGQPLLELADLSTVWLMADVYEQDLSWVAPGTRARVELPYAPGEALVGTVDFVYDTLDPETRAAKARISLRNPGGRLKPGMYATVTLVGGASDPTVVVPDEALVRTGTEDLVILALGEGRFRPVPVEVGLISNGRAQILHGLAGGEEVVTSAQFLIDSEARLQSALENMAGQPPSDAATLPSPSGDVKSMRVDVHAADANGDRFVFQCRALPHLVADTEAAIEDCTGEVERVSIGAAQTRLARAGYTNVPVDVAAADRNGDGFVYQDPMDWAVLHDAPGRCEVCGMNLERKSLAEARQNLVRNGYQAK